MPETAMIPRISRRLRMARRALLLAGLATALPVLAVTLPMLLPTASAEPALPPSGVLQLEARASADVTPDRTVATLAAVAQGSDIAKLNAQVAKTLDEALRRARAAPGVQAGTGSVGTVPRWRDSGGTMRQDGWTVTAVLTLRAADAQALSGLLGELGGTLQLQSVQAEMSAAQRQHELEQLSARAIAAFRARAQAAARDFGYAGYTLGQVQLSGLQGSEPQPQPRPLLRQMLNAQPMAQPAIAVQPAGQEVGVSVSGTVQLVR